MKFITNDLDTKNKIDTSEERKKGEVINKQWSGKNVTYTPITDKERRT